MEETSTQGHTKARNGSSTVQQPEAWYRWVSFKKKVQLNPAIAHFKGLVKIMLYTEVFTIANIKITMKIFL